MDMDDAMGMVDPAAAGLPERDLTIGEVSAVAGVSADALRYYERAGLMRDPVPRDESGRRSYGIRDLRWVVFIARLRCSGMPIGMIRRYAELARRGGETALDRLTLLQEHRRNVRAQLDELARAMDVIDHKISLYRGMGDTFMLEKTTLGATGIHVGVIGLGCMGMSAFYTGAGQDDAEAVRTIRRAVELGCTLIDTAEVYGPYANEELVGRALKGIRDEAVLATKFGVLSHLEGGVRRYDGRPENVRLAVEGSLRRLDTDRIDLYYQHRPDPSTPVEETAGALAELVEEGKILAYGLSEADPETIRRAHAVHPVAAVQTEYSLWTRDGPAHPARTRHRPRPVFAARARLPHRAHPRRRLPRPDRLPPLQPAVHGRGARGEPAHRRPGRGDRRRGGRRAGPGRPRLAARQGRGGARRRPHPRHAQDRQARGEPHERLRGADRRADRRPRRPAPPQRRPLSGHEAPDRHRPRPGRGLTRRPGGGRAGPPAGCMTGATGTGTMPMFRMPAGVCTAEGESP